MRPIITITVRLSSSRLKRKAMKKICNKHMIELLIERAKQSKLSKKIVLCTTTNTDDDALIEIAKKNNIDFFRGDKIDVVKRLYEAATFFNADFIVSLGGDNPLSDPIYSDKIIKKYKETNADFISALDLPFGTFPYGVKVSALGKIMKLKEEEDTEVWGQYFTKTNMFKSEKIEVESELKNSGLRLTVDTAEDFKLMKKIFEYFYPKDNNFSLKKVVRFLKENPSIARINSTITQKKALDIDVKPFK